MCRSPPPPAAPTSRPAHMTTSSGSPTGPRANAPGGRRASRARAGRGLPPETARGRADARLRSRIPSADEAPELAHHHGPLVDPELIDLDAPDRRLLRIEVLRTHREVAAGYPPHRLEHRRGGNHGHMLILRRRRVRRHPPVWVKSLSDSAGRRRGMNTA